MEAPTCEQILEEEGLIRVLRESDPSWRHGTYEREVYRRDDGSFWEVRFRLSTDRETNELREGTAQIKQVFPKKKEITVYE